MGTNNVVVRRDKNMVRRSPVRAPDDRAAFRALLDAIQVAACIVGASGEILCANEIAADSLMRHRGSLTRATTRTNRDRTWDLTPLRIGAANVGFLAIRRSERDEGRMSEAVPSAIVRWSLTARQGHVLTLIGRGLTNAAIGDELGIAVATVEFHVSAIFDKAGVQNRASLVAKISDM